MHSNVLLFPRCPVGWTRRGHVWSANLKLANDNGLQPRAKRCNCIAPSTMSLHHMHLRHSSDLTWLPAIRSTGSRRSDIAISYVQRLLSCLFTLDGKLCFGLKMDLLTLYSIRGSQDQLCRLQHRPRESYRTNSVMICSLGRKMLESSKTSGGCASPLV